MRSGPPVPSLAEVEAILGDADPVNRITRAYHALSAGLAARTGPVANWCTFAAWASRQAGQTIRREDLVRALEAGLGGAEDVGEAVTRVAELLRRAGRVADRAEVVAALREVVSPVRAAERAAAAVSQGNTKVFAEIGREFARLVPVVAGGTLDAAALARVCAGLRPGPPPDSQDLVGAAFAGYGRALAAPGEHARDGTLLANLRIGFHEQTRLQPEIAEALDATVGDPRDLARALRQRLLGDGDTGPAGRAVRRALDAAAGRLLERVRRRVRRIITGHLMTLELPEGRVRLGQDLAGTCPPHLASPRDPELCALLARVDPVTGGTSGSGAEDWADLAQRMHFIAELFRTRQGDAALLEPPEP